MDATDARYFGLIEIPARDFACIATAMGVTVPTGPVADHAC